MRLFRGFLLLLFISGMVSGQLNANYNVVLEENGNSLVTVVVTGLGTINVPLPLDVVSPAVRDALYVKASNGVEVSIDAEGQSTIVYKSALLTSRHQGSWRFHMDLPRFNQATVIVYIPENAQIMSTSPSAAISHVGKSKSIIYNLNPKNQTYVEAEYSFTSQPHADERKRADINALYALLFVLLPVLAVLAIVYMVKRRPGRLVLSGGKQNVLKTLTGNETKIVNLLLQNRDGMRRNELERQSLIPKSSLASSLYNLEQRNVISVDKSQAVHYVELSEWFKNL